MRRVTERTSFVALLPGEGNESDLPLLGDYVGNIAHKNARQYLLSDAEVADICEAFLIVREELVRREQLDFAEGQAEDGTVEMLETAGGALDRADDEIEKARDAIREWSNLR